MSTKDDVFNYVMNSPEDTNPAVLRSLLNGIVEGTVINDDTPSTSTVYSSSKVESIIPANELPEVSASDFGKYLTVRKFTDGSYHWSKGDFGARLLGRIYEDGQGEYKFTRDSTGELGYSMTMTSIFEAGYPVFCCLNQQYGDLVPNMILTGAYDETNNKLIFSGMYRKATSTVYVYFEHTITWGSIVTNEAVTIKEIADPA